MNLVQMSRSLNCFFAGSPMRKPKRKARKFLGNGKVSGAKPLTLFPAMLVQVLSIHAFAVRADKVTVQ
jgi:hypothetical protein